MRPVTSRWGVACNYKVAEAAEEVAVEEVAETTAVCTVVEDLAEQQVGEVRGEAAEQQQQQEAACTIAEELARGSVVVEATEQAAAEGGEDGASSTGSSRESISIKEAAAIKRPTKATTAVTVKRAEAVPTAVGRVAKNNRKGPTDILQLVQSVDEWRNANNVVYEMLTSAKEIPQEARAAELAHPSMFESLPPPVVSLGSDLLGKMYVSRNLEMDETTYF